MKKNNLVLARTASGGIAPGILIEKPVLEKVERFLARNRREYHNNPAKCVIPEFDEVQSDPIVREMDTFGYETLWVTIFAVLTGWHFVRNRFRPLYRANSEGLRLIAHYGSPRKAYASLYD